MALETPRDHSVWEQMVRFRPLLDSISFAQDRFIQGIDAIRNTSFGPFDSIKRTGAGFSLISSFDHGEAQHAERESYIVKNICQFIGVPDHFRELLEITAYVHDVGKKHPLIRDALKKKQPPNRYSEEFQLSKKIHPILSAMLIIRAGLPIEVALLALEHHEKPNKKNGEESYPLELTKNQIHPLASLLRLCDLMDSSINSKNNRRPSITLEQFFRANETDWIQICLELSGDKGIVGYENFKQWAFENAKILVINRS